MLFTPGLTKTNFNEAAGINNEKGMGLSSDYKTAATQTPEEVAGELVKALDAKKYFHVSGGRNRMGVRLVTLLPNCNGQFITRKPFSNELLIKAEKILNNYFGSDQLNNGLPTAQFLAEELHLSSKYLSDCLKQFTGSTTQQWIHEKLIERAKERLSTTQLSVSEIAYELVTVRVRLPASPRKSL